MKLATFPICSDSQVYEDDTHGFTKDANRSLAVVGNYLILSNANDFTNMPVLDRYTGKYLPDVKVNCDGIPSTFCIEAITMDEAGHLVAMPFAAVKDSWGKYSEDIIVYVWKNGIDKAPECIMQHKLTNGLNGRTLNALGSAISVRGDITKGDAVLGTIAPFDLRYIMFHFQDGVYKDAQVEWRCSGDVVAGVYRMAQATPVSTKASRNMIILLIMHGMEVEEISSMYLPMVNQCHLISLCRHNISGITRQRLWWVTIILNLMDCS